MGNCAYLKPTNRDSLKLRRANTEPPKSLEQLDADIFRNELMLDIEPKSALLPEEQSFDCSVPDEHGNAQHAFLIQTGRFELIIKHESDQIGKQAPTIVLHEVLEQPRTSEVEVLELVSSEDERMKRQQELIALA